MKKGFLAGMLTMLVLLGLIGTAYATVGKRTMDVDYMDIQIKLDGQVITPKDANGNVVEPFAYQGTTYLPVRAVSEALGLDVDWDSNTNTVLLMHPEWEAAQIKAVDQTESSKGDVLDELKLWVKENASQRSANGAYMYFAQSGSDTGYALFYDEANDSLDAAINYYLKGSSHYFTFKVTKYDWFMPDYNFYINKKDQNATFSGFNTLQKKDINGQMEYVFSETRGTVSDVTVLEQMAKVQLFDLLDFINDTLGKVGDYTIADLGFTSYDHDEAVKAMQG